MLKVYIVDDHQVIIEGLSLMLPTLMDCEIIGSATNGQQAVNEILAKQPDIVIMDLSIPGEVNGMEATQLIKSSNTGIKVIVLTMLSNIYTLKLALKSGADAFMVKNAGTDEIVMAIESVMQDQLYIHSELNASFIEAMKSNVFSGKTLVTDMELNVISKLALGLTTEQVAEELFRSVETIKSHRKNLLKKFNCKNTIELVSVLTKAGIIT